MSTRALLVAALLLVACGTDDMGCPRSILGPDYPCRERAKFNGDTCQDTATMVATSAGSPSYHECENKHHRMKVQPVTLAGNEIGALVFCECDRGDR